LLQTLDLSSGAGEQEISEVVNKAPITDMTIT